MPSLCMSQVWPNRCSPSSEPALWTGPTVYAFVILEKSADILEIQVPWNNLQEEIRTSHVKKVHRQELRARLIPTTVTAMGPGPWPRLSSSCPRWLLVELRPSVPTEQFMQITKPQLLKDARFQEHCFLATDSKQKALGYFRTMQNKDGVGRGSCRGNAWERLVNRAGPSGSPWVGDTGVKVDS